MPVQRLEFRSDESRKFWEIEQQGAETTVRYGKIGSEGQTRTKVHASPEAARAAAAKLLESKTAKGYAAVDGFAVGSAPTVELPRGGPAPAGAVSLYAVRRADAGGALIPASRLQEAARTLSFCRDALEKFEAEIAKAPVAEPAPVEESEGDDARTRTRRMIAAMFADGDKISAETRDVVPQIRARFEALFEGARAPLLTTPIQTDLPRGAIEDLQPLVHAIADELAALKLPYRIHNPARTLHHYRTPPLDVPHLDVAAFDALSVSDRLNVIDHPNRWDCIVDDLDGGKAEAEKLVGKAAVGEIIEQLWEAAEDSNADNEELSGEAWISISVLQKDDQTLAYQISGHLEVEPYGGDFTYDLYADSRGKTFESTFR